MCYNMEKVFFILHSFFLYFDAYRKRYYALPIYEELFINRKLKWDSFVYICIGCSELKSILNVFTARFVFWTGGGCCFRKLEHAKNLRS